MERTKDHPVAAVFDVTFTDGTVERATVTTQRFEGEASIFRVGNTGIGLSPERAATSWAWHRLMERAVDGAHTIGIASIRPAQAPPAPLPLPAPGKLWEFPGG